MAGSCDVAMTSEASGLQDPVPGSPGSPASAEAGMAAILARLSGLEEELKKAKDESAHLREVVERMRSGEKKDDGEDDEEECEPSAAMPSNIPTAPESFRMTPLKPDPPGLPVSF